MTSGIAVVEATHTLVEQALAVAAPEPKRAVSSRVARQMLYLLGDNEAWSTRPVGDDMAIWTGLRHENEAVRAEFVALFPEQAEALRAAYRSWGLNWLRSCTEAVTS